jgi:hypothetical protein
MRIGSRQVFGAVVLVAAVAALAGAASSASQRPLVAGGTFRADTTGASWQVDPALAYILQLRRPTSATTAPAASASVHAAEMRRPERAPPEARQGEGPDQEAPLPSWQDHAQALVAG